jgi:LacI family transcriptional regulator
MPAILRLSYKTQYISCVCIFLLYDTRNRPIALLPSFPRIFGDFTDLLIMKPATTVLELSKILNLSVSTVSRALKNHPNIAKETKQRVLQLAKELDYEPNLVAVGLRTSSTMELAVIVPNLSGFFYDSFITVLEEEAGKMGYSLFILLSGDDPETEIINLKVCRQRRVAGIFACITPLTEDLAPFQKLLELEIPILFFDKVPTGDFNKICLDDEQAARLSAEALLESKRNHVLALFGDMKLSISERRKQAFITTFGKDVNRLQTAVATNAQEAYDAVMQSFRKSTKPDAIFCMSDEILTGAMKAIQELGVKVPREVAVLTISNGFFPKLYYPEITYVETSARKLGKLAFQRMMEYVGGDRSNKELTVESVMIKGGSI